MEEMKKCFFITPFGEENSEIQKNAEFLREALLEPVLSRYGFEVRTGSYLSGSAYIGSAVADCIRDADLCIADVSYRRITEGDKAYTDASPNVFFEIGLREAIGKPIIFLRNKSSEPLPTDIIGKLEVNYESTNLSWRKTKEDLIHTVEAILEQIAKSEAEPDFKKVTMEELSEQLSNIVDKGINQGPLSELTEILRRVEGKIDQLINGNMLTAPEIAASAEIGDPADLLRLALRRRDIPMAERAMDRLAGSMEKMKWLDQVVETTASIGSKKAGDILVQNALDFMGSAQSFKKKTEYLGCLVSNLNRTDREEEYRELVEQICDLLKEGSDHEDPEVRIQINNQLNRLYYGLYATTDDKKWLDMAITELETALKIADTGFLHFNLATCLKERKTDGAIEEALRHALISIELDDEPDADHLALACRLLHDAGDPRLSDYLEMLEKVDAVKATLLRSSWRI